MTDRPIFPEGEGVLVVTHMQRDFLRRKGLPAQSAIESTYSEIEEADRRGWGIVALALNPKIYGDVHEGIMSRIRQNDGWIYWEGSSQDASVEVFTACNVVGFDLDLLRFCGINANACVFDTAVGVCAKSPDTQVEVSTDATHTFIQNYNWWHYGREEAKRIKLVRWNRELIVPGPRMQDQEDAQFGVNGLYRILGR